MLFKTKKCKRYSESFKSQVLSEVLSGLNSISEIRKKYNLGTMTISRWRASEGIASGINLIDVPLPSGMKSSKEVQTTEEDLPQDLATLQALLKRERIQRKAAELRAESLEKVTEITEREYQVDFRKKSDAKQSPK